MTTTIVTPDQDAVVSEIQIAAPPERVFKALTDAGQHEGFAGDLKSAQDHGEGWKRVLGWLEAFVRD